MKLTLSTSSPALGGIIVAEHLKLIQSEPIDITWGKNTSVTLNSQELPAANSNDVSRILVRKLAESQLYGVNSIEKTEVDHWLSYVLGPLKSKGDFLGAIQYLNRVLGPLTYLVGKRVTIADFILFAELYGNSQWHTLIQKNEAPDNVLRWYQHISVFEAVTKAVELLPDEAKVALLVSSNIRQSVERATSTTGRAQEGKFVELPGAEMGKVVVRFPPEASGYLHIGHAKAALLNQYYQQAFDGKLILRFDDTNPAKENVHFEKVILEDIKMLDIKPDMFTHTSQYFDLMLQYCEQLLKDGKAYADDTEPELMKQQREQKIESENRSNTYEQNLKFWQEMQKGTANGQKCCIRAKIDMQSPNGCMRDPTIYRCKNEAHARTGTKYKVYPTYDFACPIVDAIENVTHTLRTMEYHDRDAQFYWFIEALSLRKPYIWEFSRLSMTNTVLSKRKLTWFVENNLVDGWDDPRFPTVRGVLRRGMTVEGLKQFIIAQGSSRSVVFMEWDKIWAFNKKVIDPIAPRYTAVDCDSPVPVLVKGVKEEKLQVPKHPKNEDIGNKDVWVGPRVLIDLADAETLKEGENATFINWGNLLINKINRENGKVVSVDATPNLENKDYKKTLKLTWLAETEKAPFTPTWCVYFDHIISKPLLGKDEDFKQFVGQQTRTQVQMLGDPELKKLKKGDIIQLQRRGFFKVDVAYLPFSLHSCKEGAVILFSVPDGHTKENPTGGAPKVASAAKEVKPVKVQKSSTPAQVNQSIVQQGDLVRNLKSQKASKGEIDAAVKDLLSFKAEYKALTNIEWKPGCVPVDNQVKPAEVQKGSTPAQVNEKIVQQGDLVRNLKSQKASKGEIDAAVKDLLSFKAEYKALTNTEWKPGCVSVDNQVNPAEVQKGSTPAQVNEKIVQQGDLVRNLKSQKASKGEIDAAVKDLLSFKAEYKALTNTEWKPGCVPVDNQVKPAEVQKSSTPAQVNENIVKQGDLVRNLKSQKAAKGEIDAAVKDLLSFKSEYKALTNTEWKPGCVPVDNQVKPAEVQKSSSPAQVNEKIVKQGDLVRNLKSQKAAKGEIDAAVKDLLSFKAEYKELTKTDWKPGCVPSDNNQAGGDSSISLDEINNSIVTQGEKVRLLKASKGPKEAIDIEVKALLSLKADYKKLSGSDWKPGAAPPAVQKSQMDSTNSACPLDEVNSKIAAQGEKVRQLKASKASKEAIDPEVKVLLALKADYKKLSGSDGKPGVAPPVQQPNPVFQVSSTNPKDALTCAINDQGEVVRKLKSSGGSQTELQDAIKKLLELKTEYKNLTGTDFPSAGRTSKPKEEKASKPKEEKAVKQKKVQVKEKKPLEVEESGGVKKQTRLGLEAKKEENLPDWYSQVITKGELIEYYDVSGCYILRPWSYSIWEAIKEWFDSEIKKLGVQNCYFPIFVSRNALEKEKTHIADFSPEVAWVTKSGDSDLAEPVAVRPTSETVMYPAYAKWIQSYRDLPIKLNQWNNVVRWEFKHPQPFLRTREFLWQEGHTAFANKEEACEEVEKILNLYAKVYTDLLAIPVIKGRKTEKEKFAGGDYTLTIEAFISATGRGIQAATSHHLGQNFSKMFEIIFDHPETQEKTYVYQNSWGITTRTIGVMVMIHADNQGLVLPPRVASVQVVVVPCGVTVNLSESDRNDLQTNCDALEQELRQSGVRVKGDYRDNYSPGWKFNHWELKGVPIRVELGPKDMKNKQVVAVRRDTGQKVTLKRETAVEDLKVLLDNIQQNLFNKASEEFSSHTVQLTDWSQFTPTLDNKNVILVPFCGEMECEDKIKADSTRDASEVAEAGAPSMGAKSLCIPLEQPPLKSNTKCIHPECKNKAKHYTLFGRSY